MFLNTQKKAAIFIISNNVLKLSKKYKLTIDFIKNLSCYNFE